MFIYRSQNEISVKFFRKNFSSLNGNFSVFNRKTFCGVFSAFLGEKAKTFPSTNDLPFERVNESEGCLRKTINHTELKNWKLFKYLAKAIEKCFVPVKLFLLMMLLISHFDGLGQQHDSWNLLFVQSITENVCKIRSHPSTFCALLKRFYVAWKQQ